eukprot:TRINITY_DN5702_c0_g1_i1.p1 TRINITY_DN5702_c0_g1~~TRINITY_DN5702_c0_g1_i1.p1  ORF type:complete len:1580 (+),score=375.33 TRINITY_DN5702_c0_g1_i1:150-4742(+)
MDESTHVSWKIPAQDSLIVAAISERGEIGRTLGETSLGLGGEWGRIQQLVFAQGVLFGIIKRKHDEKNSLLAWPLSTCVSADSTFPKSTSPVRMKLELEENEVFPVQIEVHRGYSQERLLLRTDEGLLIEANLAENLLESIETNRLTMKQILINTEEDGLKIVQSIDGCGRGWVCMTDDLGVYFTTDLGTRHFIGCIPCEHTENARIFCSREFLACVIDGTVHQVILPDDEESEEWDHLEWSVLFHTPSITGFYVGDSHFILFEDGAQVSEFYLNQSKKWKRRVIHALQTRTIRSAWCRGNSSYVLLDTGYVMTWKTPHDLKQIDTLGGDAPDFEQMAMNEKCFPQLELTLSKFFVESMSISSDLFLAACGSRGQTLHCLRNWIRPVFEHYWLYETPNWYLLVGGDACRDKFRVMRIARGEPDDLILRVDPMIYDPLQIDSLLSTLKGAYTTTDKKGSLKDTLQFRLVVEGYGILGLIKFLKGYYILMITERKRVGTLAGQVIYEIQSVETVPLFSVKERWFSKSDEKKYLDVFENLDLKRDFYFSYTYDLSCSLQGNMSSSLPLKESRMFIWNEHLLQPLLDRVRDPEWILPVIHGYFGQVEVEIGPKSLVLTVIGRRSRFFAGTRYLKRGANAKGNVANEVETEQIVGDVGLAQSRVLGGHFSSYVQLRGSVPLVWSHFVDQAIVRPKPDILMGPHDPTYSVAQKHFEHVRRRFGNPIVVISLIKRKEKVKREQYLGDEYGRCILHLNSKSVEGDEISYIPWDFRAMSKHSVSRLVNDLSEVSRKHIQRTGIFYTGSHAPRCSQFDSENIIQGFQSGVIRTNCIDCLDRTNIAQYCIGLDALGYQLYRMGFSEEPFVRHRASMRMALLRLYEEIGDRLSEQYGGSKTVSVGLHSRGMSWDMRTNIRRFYSNNFRDAVKQNAIDIFLGNFIPSDEVLPVWKLARDSHMHMSLSKSLSFRGDYPSQSGRRDLFDAIYDRSGAGACSPYQERVSRELILRVFGHLPIRFHKVEGEEMPRSEWLQSMCLVNGSSEHCSLLTMIRDKRKERNSRDREETEDESELSPQLGSMSAMDDIGSASCASGDFEIASGGDGSTPFPFSRDHLFADIITDGKYQTPTFRVEQAQREKWFAELGTTLSCISSKEDERLYEDYVSCNLDHGSHVKYYDSYLRMHSGIENTKSVKVHVAPYSDYLSKGKMLPDHYIVPREMYAVYLSRHHHISPVFAKKGASEKSRMPVAMATLSEFVHVVDRTNLFELEEAFLKALDAMRKSPIVDVRDRLWYGRPKQRTGLVSVLGQQTYIHKCFVGSDLLEWMTKHSQEYLKVENSHKALEMFQLLLNTNSIFPVRADGFLDTGSLYRFDIDMKRNFLNEDYDSWMEPGESPLELSIDLLQRLSTIAKENPEGKIDDLLRHEGYIEFRKRSSALRRVAMGSMSEVDCMHFFVNVFNTLTIDASIHVHKSFGHGLPLSLQSVLNTVGYVIGGHYFSLNDIKHGVLRGNRFPPGELRRCFIPSRKDSRLVCSNHIAINTLS